MAPSRPRSLKYPCMICRCSHGAGGTQGPGRPVRASANFSAKHTASGNPRQRARSGAGSPPLVVASTSQAVVAVLALTVLCLNWSLSDAQASSDASPGMCTGFFSGPTTPRRPRVHPTHEPTLCAVPRRHCRTGCAYCRVARQDGPCTRMTGRKGGSTLVFGCLPPKRGSFPHWITVH
jgi:hypothetical protein